MAVSIPTNGVTSIAALDSTTSSLALSVPSGAQAGDVLFILGVAENNGIPTIRLNNATTGLTTGRSESSVNVSTAMVWKRLTSNDLGGTIGIFSTVPRRQALVALAVSGAQDPVFTNHPFSGQSATVSAVTPPNYTPAANNSLAVSAWAIVRVISPYTGYTFAPSSPWTERAEASAQYTGNLSPTAYLATNLLGSGTGAVSQQNLTLTSTTSSWDSMTSTVVFAPGSGANPTARATVIQPLAEINATASTPAAGGALSYSIAPAVGVSQPSPGLFLAPYTNSPQSFTVTVSETGGGTSTVQATVPAAPSGSSGVTNTTGVETVRFRSGGWI